MPSDSKVKGRAGNYAERKDQTNYFSVHGTVPNMTVKQDSHLCEDLHKHLISKSQNIRGEVQIPSGFEGFEGYDGRAAKTHNGLPFVIKFGSQMDSASMKFSEDYEKYQKDRKKSKPDANEGNSTIFEVLSEYLNKIMELSKPIVWMPAQ